VQDPKGCCQQQATSLWILNAWWSELPLINSRYGNYSADVSARFAVCSATARWKTRRTIAALQVTYCHTAVRRVGTPSRWRAAPARANSTTKEVRLSQRAHDP